MCRRARFLAGGDLGALQRARWLVYVSAEPADAGWRLRREQAAGAVLDLACRSSTSGCGSRLADAQAHLGACDQIG